MGTTLSVLRTQTELCQDVYADSVLEYTKTRATMNKATDDRSL